MYELSKQKKIDTISTMIVIIDILSNQEVFFAIEYICLADQLTHTHNRLVMVVFPDTTDAEGRVR